MQITTIGLDIAKHVFQVHRIDANEKVVVRRRLRRSQVIAYFSVLPHCVIGMEACATSNHWARELTKFGHTIRLMPAKDVKAYVKRNKNDAADAAAICEAVRHPTIRFVGIKSAAQRGQLMQHRTRGLLIRRRTQLINALRVHLAELGIVAAQGCEAIRELLAIVADERDARLPVDARASLIVPAAQFQALQILIGSIEKRIKIQHRSNGASKRLETILGIGVIGATAIVATAPDPTAFRSGRDFAAWIGLVPRQDSRPQMETTTHQAAADRSVEAHVYSVHQDNAVFKVTVDELKDTGLEESAVIDHAIKTMSEGGEVKVSIPHRINRVYGRQLSIVGRDGIRSMVALFDYSGRLYQIEGKALPSGNDGTADAIRFVQSLIFTGGGSNRSAEEIRAAQAACSGPGGSGGAAVAGGDGRRLEVRCRRQQTFVALVTSLNSGDLSGAQQAYSSLTQFQRVGKSQRAIRARNERDRTSSPERRFTSGGAGAVIAGAWAPLSPPALMDGPRADAVRLPRRASRCPGSCLRVSATSIDLDAIRQIVDRIAVTQEQITRIVMQGE